MTARRSKVRAALTRAPGRGWCVTVTTPTALRVQVFPSWPSARAALDTLVQTEGAVVCRCDLPYRAGKGWSAADRRRALG